MVLDGLGPSPFQLDVLTYQGDRLRVDVAPVVVLEPAANDHKIVYLIRRCRRRRSDDALDMLPGDGPPSRDPRLSPREIAVLRLIADGENAREIAGHLHISTSAVRNHVRHILAKLKVGKQTVAVAIGIRRGLI